MEDPIQIQHNVVFRMKLIEMHLKRLLNSRVNFPCNRTSELFELHHYVDHLQLSLISIISFDSSRDNNIYGNFLVPPLIYFPFIWFSEDYKSADLNFNSYRCIRLEITVKHQTNSKSSQNWSSHLLPWFYLVVCDLKTTIIHEAPRTLIVSFYRWASDWKLVCGWMIKLYVARSGC